MALEITFIAATSGLVLGLFVWIVFNWIISFPSRLNVSNIPNIYQVQSRTWFPLKYFLFRVILWFRKLKNVKRLQNEKATGRGAGYGVKSRNSPEEMDQAQELPISELLAVDAVYFNGGNKDGAFFVAAIARRQENIGQTILYLYLPEIGLLELPSLPDTWLQSHNHDSDDISTHVFAAGGLCISPLQAMKIWKLAFNGMMRRVSTGEMVKVEFDLLWSATTEYFDFDTDLHPHTMAEAIARERWSREYFDVLQKAHQTHYEQFGEITGALCVDGSPIMDFQVQGVRDHSYGNVRDWKYFHRYVINYAYFEDGSSLCVGTICMPISLSRLVIGYLFQPDGTMHPVSHSDFEFYNFGEDGVPPEEFAISFVAGKKSYRLECRALHSPVFYMGKDWDAKIHERMCEFTVNGTKGWGISEWEYNYHTWKKQETSHDNIAQEDAGEKEKMV